MVLTAQFLIFSFRRAIIRVSSPILKKKKLGLFYWWYSTGGGEKREENKWGIFLIRKEKKSRSLNIGGALTFNLSRWIYRALLMRTEIDTVHHVFVSPESRPMGSSKIIYYC